MITQSGNTFKYVVVIGVSTGGPQTLKELFSNLPKELPLTYVVVQHMPEGYIPNMAHRINQISSLTIKTAVNGDILRQGEVYISPGGHQCQIINAAIPTIKITTAAHYKGYRPSVNLLFSSLAKLNINSIGIVLTGMGQDGLDGVQDLRNTNKSTIIVQDQASSVVYGMPRAIYDAKLHDHIVSINEMSNLIKKLVR
ncbi:CheB methylesterase domain-containing protein [Candidatus Epulonipiscium viviparus]|uniref:CheB methylesterase domain-containing protein n=1 Tax=Candidatus Epulonipiscium viviparus TaxID=420336 RepID=UPI00016C0EF3|nr:CheB methylesterase domain-containing protein [Candidatus Epulopiscium viviparus]